MERKVDVGFHLRSTQPTHYALNENMSPRLDNITTIRNATNAHHLEEKQPVKMPEDIYQDFTEWPMRWMGVKKDVKYGQGILQVMRPFVESLIASGLSVKTIKRHMDNLWVLGGEIIRAKAHSVVITNPSLKAGVNTKALRQLYT